METHQIATFQTNLTIRTVSYRDILSSFFEPIRKHIKLRRGSCMYSNELNQCKLVKTASVHI